MPVQHAPLDAREQHVHEHAEDAGGEDQRVHEVDVLPLARQVDLAAELRVKESDRISSIARNLRALGADVEEFADGMFVPGRQSLRGSLVDTFGDHRIAMAFLVMGLASERPVTVDDVGFIATSFPSFVPMMAGLGAALG